MVRGSLDEDGVAIRYVVELGLESGTTALCQDVNVVVYMGVQ